METEYLKREIAGRVEMRNELKGQLENAAPGSALEDMLKDDIDILSEEIVDLAAKLVVDVEIDNPGFEG